MGKLFGWIPKPARTGAGVAIIGMLVGFLISASVMTVVNDQGWFDASVVTAIVDRHASGREDLSRQIWGLMAFSLWHERYA